METQNLRDKINHVIDEMPDDVLENILDYLKYLNKTPKNKINLSTNLTKIINEDKNLLERLAK